MPVNCSNPAALQANWQMSD